MKSPILRGCDLSYLHTTTGAAPPDARALFEVTLVDFADKTILHRGTQQRIRSGDVGLRSPFEVGKLVRRHQDATRVRILALDEAELLDACDEVGCRPRDLRSVLTYGAHSRLFAVTSSVFEAMEAGAPAIQIQTMLARSAAEVIRTLSRTTTASTPQRSPTSARRIRELLHDRLTDDLTLDDVAAEVALSRAHIVHVFQGAYHLGPFEYLMKIRVAKARELLAIGLRPIDVAHACGFCDQSHLNRWFTRAVGVTPGRYAEAVRSPKLGAKRGHRTHSTT